MVAIILAAVIDSCFPVVFVFDKLKITNPDLGTCPAAAAAATIKGCLQRQPLQH